MGRSFPPNQPRLALISWPAGKIAHQIETLVRIGLCARPPAHAKLCAQDLASIDPETVNNLTPERLMWFSQEVPLSRRKHMLQKFRAFFGCDG